MTTVFPPDEEKARAVLIDVADAMREYRDQHGEWPANLDQLDSRVDLTYRWHRVVYEPEDSELWLYFRIALEPDIVFRLTFGYIGGTDVIHGVGRNLR